MSTLPDVGDQPVSYGFWRDPNKFLMILFSSPNYTADPKYADALKLSSTSVATKYASSESPALLFKYAERKYDRTLNALDKVNAQRDEYLKIGLTFLTVTVALAGYLKVSSLLLVLAAVGPVAASVCVLLLSRRPGAMKVEANIQKIREAIHSVENPNDWFAATLHLVDRGAQVAIDIRAAQLNVAIWLLATSVVSVVGVIAYDVW